MKLLVRHESMEPVEFRERVLAAAEGLASATWSVDGLVEISAAGVTKAMALERLAAGLGVTATGVVAFGDMPNDLAMLRWAGTSYAMGNAHPSVRRGRRQGGADERRGRRRVRTGWSVPPVICWNTRVIALFSRLLVVLALACSGLVLAQAPAFACKCDVASVKKSAARADAVFSGVVVESSTQRGGARETDKDVYRVEAETVYQGDVTAAEVEVVSPVTSCGLGGLEQDRAYVFFVAARGTELRADQCGGSGRATDRRIAALEDALGPGTPLNAKPEPTEVSFKPVDNGAPQSLTRMAAPGGALVLIGLLGLLVVRRASRA